ncbi:hypothetical protein [Scytonema sp. NUACC21]
MSEIFFRTGFSSGGDKRSFSLHRSDRAAAASASLTHWLHRNAHRIAPKLHSTLHLSARSTYGVIHRITVMLKPLPCITP